MHQRPLIHKAVIPPLVQMQYNYDPSYDAQQRGADERRQARYSGPGGMRGDMRDDMSSPNAGRMGDRTAGWEANPGNYAYNPYYDARQRSADDRRQMRFSGPRDMPDDRFSRNASVMGNSTSQWGYPSSTNRSQQPFNRMDRRYPGDMRDEMPEWQLGPGEMGMPMQWSPQPQMPLGPYQQGVVPYGQPYGYNQSDGLMPYQAPYRQRYSEYGQQMGNLSDGFVPLDPRGYSRYVQQDSYARPVNPMPHRQGYGPQGRYGQQFGYYPPAGPYQANRSAANDFQQGTGRYSQKYSPYGSGGSGGYGGNGPYRFDDNPESWGNEAIY